MLKLYEIRERNNWNEPDSVYDFYLLIQKRPRPWFNIEAFEKRFPEWEKEIDRGMAEAEEQSEKEMDCDSVDQDSDSDIDFPRICKKRRINRVIEDDQTESDSSDSSTASFIQSKKRSERYYRHR